MGPRKHDEKDVQILAVKLNSPGATDQEISDRTGIPRSTVAFRRNKLYETKEYQEAVTGCLNLLPSAVRVYESNIKHGSGIPTLQAARDILRGLGVLSERHQYEHSGEISVQQLMEKLAALPADERDKQISEMERAGAEGDQDIQ